MKKSFNEIFDELSLATQKLFKENLVKIILYGSCARGDNTEGSDMDFIILTDLSELQIRKIENELTVLSTELSLKFNCVISLIALNISHYNEYIEILPFYKNISTEGLEVYG